MNTTHSLGVESYLEQRFPTNVVLSLVSGAEITQIGASEFEHKGATDIWVGPASKNPAIPAQIQSDMADALAMTLSSGQVNCKVAPNIRQHQFERMIGYVDILNACSTITDPSTAQSLSTQPASSLRRRTTPSCSRRLACAPSLAVFLTSYWYLPMLKAAPSPQTSRRPQYAR
jgi:ketopantoate reductase